MKKSKILKAGLCAMLLAGFLSMSAFAQAEESKADDLTAPKLEAMNMLVRGTVKEAAVLDNGNTKITIENEDMGMVFHVRDGAFVLDQKTTSYLSVGDIKEGMTITAILDKHSPMTASIPPQTGGSIGFVINSEGGSLDLSVYNEELVNLENTLKLNIDEKTVIKDVRGTKQEFKADNLKGSECLVLYGVSTKSIPAQTSPDFVMILNSKDSLAAGENAATVKIKAEYVPLRAQAEAKGYTVLWTSHKDPIVLTKGDIRLELTLGSSEFKFEHMTMDIKPLDMLERLDFAVKLVDGATMVPSTLIEAL